MLWRVVDVVITCARGTEAALQSELERLKINAVVGRAHVSLPDAELLDAYRVGTMSRVANRVLIPIADLDAPTDDELYEQAHDVAWEEHFDPRATFAVECVCSDRQRNSHYLTLRTKDAIVDRLRDKTGQRPNVDRDDPTVRVHVHLDRDAYGTLSIDLFGPLHRRGYRQRGARAPLRETLAGAILELAGYRGERDFVDPMCGSGTLVVEAAMIANGIAPGLRREPARDWRGHDRSALKQARQEARALRREPSVTIYGSDHDMAAVKMTRASLRAAGVNAEITKAAIQNAKAPTDKAGVLITNPPYGARLGRGEPDRPSTELTMLYQDLGDSLRRGFPGWSTFVFSGSPKLAKRIGLKPRRRYELFNGALDCRLLDIPIGAAVTSARRSSRAKDVDMFENRFKKNLKKRTSWAKREGLEAYRVYDRDIPEYNVAVDVYGDAAVVSEWSPPRQVDAGLAAQRLRGVMATVPGLLGIDPERVHLRTREKKRHDLRGEQYEREERGQEPFVVQERGHRFEVLLGETLDTGLFLDGRDLRAAIAKSEPKRFLNLFAYTCSASVYAAKAGAETVSVDLSQRYLGWGERNFKHNDIATRDHHFVPRDVFRFLDKERERYDVILLAPPSFSRSHRMDDELDLIRDHGELIDGCLDLLTNDGVLFFSTHARDLTLDHRFARQAEKVETTPEDFQRVAHQTWKITL